MKDNSKKKIDGQIVALKQEDFKKK